MTTKRMSRPRPPADAANTAAQAIALIGEKIRTARSARRMTLQALSDATSLTPSMLSLVERGRASPSIGSLILIAQALGVTISDLVPMSGMGSEEIVVRADSKPTVETSERLLRSILRQDAKQGALISTTIYRPNTGSSRTLRAHGGFEHGFMLDGELTVEIESLVYRLAPGDLISYSSSRPHRIWNYSKRTAKALWINMQWSGIFEDEPAK